jgi:hypothetical protein
MEIPVQVLDVGAEEGLLLRQSRMMKMTKMTNEPGLYGYLPYGVGLFVCVYCMGY